MKPAVNATPADEWEPVEPTRDAGLAAVRVRLSRTTKAGAVRLGLSANMAVLGKLGWQAGTPLMLGIGKGPRAGWIRVAYAAQGRPLRPLGRGRKVLFAALDAGPLAVYEAETLPAEWRIEGDALLVELPWRLPPAAAAEEVGA
jgi:hypothetical protein